MGKRSKNKQSKNVDTKISAPAKFVSAIKPAEGKLAIVHLLIIVVAVLIGYSNSFHVPFVFDDHANIVDNPIIKDLDNFTSGGKGYQSTPRRFIGYLTFALNYHFGGLDVTGYHIVNLAIHCLNAVLVYLLAALILKTPNVRMAIPEAEGKKGIALLSALLFALHPVQTQAVTYIVQRLASLATLFYLLSVVMYIKARLLTQIPVEGGHRKDTNRSVLVIVYYLSSLFSAILAMSTKEISFTLPLVIALYEIVFVNNSPIRQRALFLIPILMTLIIIPISIMGADIPVQNILADIGERTRVQTTLPRWDYLLTEMRVITTYIRLLFLPINQNIDYDYQIYHSFFEPAVFLSFIFLVTLMGSAVYIICRSRNQFSISRITAFGVLWFFITMSVESGFIPIVDVIFEHRVYLPSIGACIAISTSAWLVHKKIESKWPPVRNIYGPAIGLAAITLLVATYARNSIWTDKVKLWEDSVSKSPKADGYISLGLAYKEKNEIFAAIEAYGKAIALAPNDSRIYVDLAVAYSKAGHIDKAIEANRKAIFLNPAGFEAYNNLGELHYKKGRIDDALKEYLHAVSLNPDSAQTHNNLGAAYWSQGLFDKAIEHYNIAIKLKPDFADAYNNLGIALGSKGMLDSAIEKFQLAIKLKPDHPSAYANLSIAYKKKGMIRQ